MSFDEIESLIVAQEVQIEKFKQSS